MYDAGDAREEYRFFTGFLSTIWKEAEGVKITFIVLKCSCTLYGLKLKLTLI
jgi:hypothetical protein